MLEQVQPSAAAELLVGLSCAKKESGTPQTASAGPPEGGYAADSTVESLAHDLIMAGRQATRGEDMGYSGAVLGDVDGRLRRVAPRGTGTLVPVPVPDEMAPHADGRVGRLTRLVRG